jgi:hypothetical protein
LTLAAAFWCVVAAQGLSTVAAVVAGHENAFTVALGGFLVLAGVLGLVRGQRIKQSTRRVSGVSLAGQFVSSLLGVILNPITFVTMTAVLAILGGVNADLGMQGMAGLALGVLLGGMTLWVGITYGVALMKHRFGVEGGAVLSKGLNCCILLLGLAYLVRPLLPHGAG